MRNACGEGYVACPRCSDGGDQVNLHTASTKKNMREKMRGDWGWSEGIANFLPAPN